MNGTTTTSGKDTTVRGLIARWLWPASLTPAEADALRGCFPVADADPRRSPTGLTPAEAEAASRGLYPAARGHEAASRPEGAPGAPTTVRTRARRAA